ncbi:putative ATP-dependent RNA helicase DDX56 [Armadillidium nasatum]|uniref:RNA helicase n=1 Tax=Armadillidium nasatum TaxID=96803 RepID=A0A5N5SVY1_9CRUS|nr:putative ATP-dependent RNA helicase DDX56 [Armadillidium nasatum]
MDTENSGLKFHEMGLDDRILEAIARSGWKEPTMIQEKAIPLFMKGKDILARARTGSGKTGAYLIPLIHTLLERKAHASQQITSTLILAPSKELCKQIKQHIEHLTSLCMREITYIDISPQVPIEAQKSLLDDNPDILIGTPLKILNHIKEGNLILNKSIQFLIIDEADLMFTYEHEKELNEVLSHLPSICQSFITSATVTEDVANLKKRLLNNPVILKLEEAPLPPDTHLTQYIVKVEDLDKIVLLYAIIKMKLLLGKTIIFVNTIAKGYKIQMFLSMFHIRSCTLNAELPLNCRCRIVDDFNSGIFSLLIATDENSVKTEGSAKSKRKKDRESGVARGIDFQHVSNVINYDVPSDATAYIHRVGRTARMGMMGTALTMVSRHDMKLFNRVENNLKEILGSKIIFRDYKFNMFNLDGFRYRACDAWKQCTAIAPHLKNLPEYNIPDILKPVAKQESRRQKIKRKYSKVKDNNEDSNDQKPKKNNYVKVADPLRTLLFEGVKGKKLKKK